MAAPNTAVLLWQICNHHSTLIDDLECFAADHCPSCVLWLLLVSLFVLQEQYGFAAKMRNQAVEQLKALETWVERQATGLDMAANPESLKQSFDKLLKVLRPQITPGA